MTLIMGAVTRDCAVLASDRRLTDGRNGNVITDAENKAVCLYGSLLIGYTGLARLDGQKTHVWIANKLAGHAIEDAFSILDEQASRAIREYPKKYRRQGFLFVGWGRRNASADFATNDLVPCAFLLSNFILPNGTHLLEAQPTFRIYSYALGNRRSAVFAAGCGITPDSMRTLTRNVGRYSRANPGNPAGIAALLGTGIVNVSDKNRAVGKKLMLASLPRVAVPADLLLIGGLWRDNMMAVYYEQGGSTVHYAPTFVHKSGVIMQDMVAKFDPRFGLVGTESEGGGVSQALPLDLGQMLL